jgi:hypothetical protein
MTGAMTFAFGAGLLAQQDGLASIETPMPTAGQCAAPPAITGWS